MTGQRLAAVCHAIEVCLAPVEGRMESNRHPEITGCAQQETGPVSDIAVRPRNAFSCALSCEAFYTKCCGEEILKVSAEACGQAPICWAKSTMLEETTSKSPGFALSGTPTGPLPYSLGRWMNPVRSPTLRAACKS